MFIEVQLAPLQLVMILQALEALPVGDEELAALIAFLRRKALGGE